MPPEPLPWDRKELLFRERKHSHERSEQLGQVARWRDSSLSSSSSYGGGSRNNNNNNGDFSPRWGFPSDFRRPPGHGKQGGWHMYPEDSGHGYPASRFGDRFLDDDGFRPSGPRGDGRYSRVYRENRTSFGQREWRSHSWEANHHQSVPRNAPGRPHSMNDQKSTGDSPMRASHPHSPMRASHPHSPMRASHPHSPMRASHPHSPMRASHPHSPMRASHPHSPMRASHPHSDLGGESHSKDHTVKTTDANGPGTGQRVDKENSSALLDWKPLKWSRSGNMCSRGSGFVHSSSSKSVGGESNVKGDLPPKNVSPIQSPSGDDVACAPSVIPSDPSEDATSRKKPRLGWGEGLAKYEKKRVDGPEEYACKTGDGTCGSAEPTHSFTSNLADKSPRIAGFSDCSSPATPSSVACSSSQGLEGKAYGRTPDADPNNFSVSSIPAPENQHEGLHFRLEKLVLNSVADLSSLISELLQADEQCSMDSGFVRSSTLNKLLLWKDDISKSLEMTEIEIDSLENELKSLKSDPGNCSPCPLSLNSLSTECKDEHCENLNVIQRPPPLEVVSSRDLVVGQTLPCADARGCHPENKDEDVDSPGTATSEFVELLSTQKPLSADGWKQCSEKPGLIESIRSVTPNFAERLDAEDRLETTCQIDDENMIHDCVASSIENLSFCGQKMDSICDTILVSNKDSAARASKILDKFLPSGDYCFNVTEANDRPPVSGDLTIKEKFLRKKRLLRFKERVLSLKYRAFQHLWKEDLRLLSLKNHRTKPQKKYDLSLRTVQSGIQKHRSSIRSRFASPAGSLSLVPTAEVTSFTGKLLSDSQVKIYRKSLMMPAMILDEKEKSLSRFVSNNGLVEDPYALEKERALTNPWTDEEKEIFMDKLATHGKDFCKIASFLDHKTTADCIEFYYKNHKSECFDKTKKKLDSGKQGKPLSSSTYLVTSEKKWSREMNAASLDILGAASVIAAQAEEAIEPSKSLSGKSKNRKPRGSDGMFEASSSYCVAEDERETTAADVLAGICGSLSSEAMSSCITSSVDPVEGNHDLKYQKVGSSGRRPLTPEVTQSIDEDTYSDESCGEMDPVDWADDEKSLFVEAFSSFGKDFVMISRVVRTKSRDQCKVFFSKARKCLGLDNIPSGTGMGDIQGRDEANGGGSDAEDACVVETGSVVCSDKSGSKMDEDLPHINQDVSKPDFVVTEKKTLEDDCNAEELNCRDDGDQEDMVLRDREECVSGLVSVCDVFDGQAYKSATADDILRGEGEMISQDDASKVEASIGLVDTEIASIPSTYLMNSVAVVGNISEMSVSKLENGLNASSASIELRDPAGDGWCLQSTPSDDSHPPQPRDSVVNQSDSTQVLKGFPLNLSLKPELNGVIPHKVVVSEVKCQSFEDSFLRKCSHEVQPSQDVVVELPLLGKNEGEAKDCATGNPCNLKREKSSRNGDVKLFGQILSKPSSTDKPTHSARMSNSKSMHNLTTIGSFEMKLATNQDTNGTSSSGKHDHDNGFLGLKNVPIRSYGFWDGTKIQTGYSSVPDSELLLAKFPEALANYSISSSKIEQPSVTVKAAAAAAALNSNECCNVNGACSFSPREVEGVQPFRLDMKQKQDAFPEAQREKFVKEGGVGSCSSGISDPVAALKLHYARSAQQYSNGGNGMIRDGTWRSQEGDVGRL